MYVHILYTKSGPDGNCFSLGPGTTVRFDQHPYANLWINLTEDFIFGQKKSNLDRYYNCLSFFQNIRKYVIWYLSELNLDSKKLYQLLLFKAEKKI